MNKKILLISSSIFLIIIFMIFSYYSYAYYSSRTSGTSSAKVANFILTIDENTTYFPYELQKTDPSSSPIYYKFIVTNKNNNKVSEVKEQYTLTLDVTRNIPLDITLYKVSKSVYDATTNSSFNATGATTIGNVTYPNSVNMNTTNTFNASSESYDYYVIKTTWNTNFKSSSYQNKIDLFKINANFEQIS